MAIARTMSSALADDVLRAHVTSSACVRRTGGGQAEDRRRTSSACMWRTGGGQLCTKRFAVFLVDNHIAIGLYLLRKTLPTNDFELTVSDL